MPLTPTHSNPSFTAAIIHRKSTDCEDEIKSDKKSLFANWNTKVAARRKAIELYLEQTRKLALVELTRHPSTLITRKAYAKSTFYNLAGGFTEAVAFN